MRSPAARSAAESGALVPLAGRDELGAGGPALPFFPFHGFGASAAGAMVWVMLDPDKSPDVVRRGCHSRLKYLFRSTLARDASSPRVRIQSCVSGAARMIALTDEHSGFLRRFPNVVHRVMKAGGDAETHPRARARLQPAFARLRADPSECGSSIVHDDAYLRGTDGSRVSRDRPPAVCSR